VTPRSEGRAGRRVSLDASWLAIYAARTGRRGGRPLLARSSDGTMPTHRKLPDSYLRAASRRRRRSPGAVFALVIVALVAGGYYGSGALFAARPTQIGSTGPEAAIAGSSGRAQPAGAPTPPSLARKSKSYRLLATGTSYRGRGWHRPFPLPRTRVESPSTAALPCRSYLSDRRPALRLLLRARPRSGPCAHSSVRQRHRPSDAQWNPVARRPTGHPSRPVQRRTSGCQPCASSTASEDAVVWRIG
jgi:hypothetical protein